MAIGQHIKIAPTRWVAIEMHFVALRQRLHERKYFFHDGVQRNRFDGKRKLFVIDGCDIEELVDLVTQVPARAQNMFDAFALLRAEMRYFQQLSKT